ncbi:translocation/assembly module TamB domain-containing protein [uncultured Cocleimonas sp.]|uniref:translocation/assembly module TamB domain-containing protein n=1 Tax=uncultured Cocleimonas sp. TaxID=1051587 RepID=UPI0026302A33|nr:translocation/assembly module TamB domain-containing protein [uncultured Cocleimonas sp.]
MRKHLNQYVFSPLFWVMSLLLVLLFALVITLFTPIGPKTIAYLADSSLKQLTLKGVSGSVLSGLHVDKFVWEDGVAVVLENIDVKLNKFDIKNEKIHAKNVTVGKLSIDLQGKTKSDEVSKDVTSLPNFGLPINLDADVLKLESLQITKSIPGDSKSQTLLFQIQDIQLNKATIKQNILNFEELKGAPIILNRPLRIDVVDGELNMNQPHEIKTKGTASFEHDVIGNVNGTVDVKGTLTNYIFDGDLVLEQKQLGKGTALVKGEGDYKQVTFDDIIFVSVHGNAEAKGNVNWDPEIRWNFDADAKNLTTSSLLPEWPASADAKIKYTGTFLDSRLENQLQIVELDGTFRGQKLTAKGQVTERESLVQANKLEVTLGDNAIMVDGAVTEPLNLDIKVDAKSLKQLVPDVAGRVEGAVTIKGEYKKPEIQAKVKANSLAYAGYKQSTLPILIETDVVVDNDVLSLKSAQIKSGKNTVSLSGTATEPLDLKWNIEANDLKQVSPQLAGSINGSATLKGLIEKPVSTLDITAKNLEFNGIRQGEEALTLKGQISLDKKIIQLKELNVASGKNILLVNGNAGEPLDLKININAPDLKQVSPDLAGRIQGDTQIVGLYKSPTITTKLVASNLQYQDFKLGQSDMNLQGEVQLVDGVPMVKELNTIIGDNRFQVTGRASSPFNLSWNIDSKNLKEIASELSGRLIVKGQLQGTIDKPIINATVDAKKIKYKTFNLDSADFTASTTNNIYKINGKLKNFESDGQKIDDANLELNGSIENHTISALIDHQEAKVQLKANGGWKNQQWSGILQQLKLDDTQAGDWALQKPARVSVSKSGFSADQFCLSSKKTNACSTASWSEASGINAKGTLNEIPLELAKPWLPEGMELNGVVNGSYDIQQNSGRPKGKIQFKLPSNSFSFKADDEVRDFFYEDAEINATIDNRTINADASMKIVNRGQFSANAKIKLSPENGKHTIDGKANFDIPNINFAQELIPHSRGLRGALSSKFSFSGLLSKPQIKGQADIKNAYLRLPEAGTELTDININVTADQPGKAKINGRMLMGKGALNVTGDMDIQDVAKWKANIKISGNNIRFMNTNEIKATMSPDIVLGLSPEVVSIKGKVTIPYADIRLNDIPESSIDESGDAFVIGERKPGEQVSAVKLQPNVIIVLGDKVRLDAFGLKARLSGDVNVTHNRRDVLANGSLRVTDGKFQAYGQDLEINNGRLIFNGSPKLVGMDIRATRTVDNQVVGVHLGGNVLNPKSTIFSNPAMPESEALSFLLTGHSLSSASGQESALLMSAVRGLGITGSGSLAQNIGASFGLDDVNIVTKEDLRESELALGKRLGSRLYVRYLFGLFDQTQKIAIKYKINKVLSLEAETSVDEYGLDLIYEFERD